MRKKTFILAVCLSVSALLFSIATPLFAHSDAHGEGKVALGCQKDEALCVVERFTTVADSLIDVSAPSFATPGQLSQARIVNYQVTTRGNITASLSEFKTQANQTLNDSRGWSRMGVSFKEVVSGGEFTLVLSEASQVPTFSSGCDSTYSCNVGNFVIINQDRWLTATPSWNNGGGSLRDYRHMVVNHETGHWLGHGHYNCGGPGQLAPVMQQQSINLQGCKFNPWPLDSELYSSRLGI